MKFEIPEDLSVLDRAALNKAIDDALAEYGDLNKVKDLDDAGVERIVALAEFVTAARGRVVEIDADEEKKAERLATARAALDAPKAETKKVEEKKVEETKTVEEPAKTEEPPAKVEDKVLEPVVASARSAVARAASGAPAVEPPAVDRPRATILASADALGAVSGAEITMDNLVDSAMKRFQAMPKGKPASAVRQPFGLANIVLAREDGLTTENRDFNGDFQALVRAAADESRLPGGSLVAAAGWCAPSETLYDLCPGLESTDGLWDLPSIQINRGGVNFTKGPDISDVFNHSGFWHYTEAQIEAGVTKPCFKVPCPDFEEVRLEVDGICIKAGVLQREGYPEIIRRYVELTLVAHAHQMSARRIAAAQTLAGAAVAPGSLWDNTNSILAALELLAIGERERLRMARNQTLEVVVPHWLLPAIRADVSNRTGLPFGSVTDQQIIAEFNARNLRPQFIYNYQPLVYNASGIVVKYPTTVEVMLYPAGTFVAAGKDLLNLQAVYDSTDLRSNEYTELFTEESYAVLNTCYDARRITLPVSVTGRTGAANISHVLGVAPTP